MRLGLWGLCSFLLTCAATGAPGVTPSGRAAEAPRLFVPSGSPAQVYTTQAQPPIAGDAFAKQIAAEIDGGRRKRGFPAVVRDGRLDRVAFDVAAAEHDCRAPAPEVVAALLWHYGVPEPEPSLFMHCGDDGAEVAAVTNMRRQFAVTGAQSGWRRVGVGVARSQGGWAAVIIFQEKNLDLDDVPRTLAAGDRAEVKGRERGGYRDLELELTAPQGAVVQVPVAAHGPSFSAMVACNRGDGIYQVEVLGRDQRGPKVLANFPIYCGVAVPSKLAFALPTVATTADPATVETRLFELVGRDRMRAGLPALVRDGRLGAVARRYSEEMATTGVVAHVSPRSGGVVDRLRAAGLAPPPTTIAENVGAATSAEDAERAFMDSPGHRANLLDPTVTHVGVGVARGATENGVPSLFITQIFVGWGNNHP